MKYISIKDGALEGPHTTYHIPQTASHINHTSSTSFIHIINEKEDNRKREKKERKNKETPRKRNI